jgi:hypothetical protein
MERKYLIENIEPLLNANVEKSNGFVQRMGLFKINLPCTHCNCSMTWCIYNKIKDKYVWK